MTERTYSIQMDMTGKNMVIAYLLWWFLGWAGVHRFYLGRIGSGITQLLLFVLGSLTAVLLVGIPLLLVWGLWWLLDAYFTYRMVVQENARLGVTSSSMRFATSSQGSSDLGQLERLHALLEKGAITREEYEARKANLL